MDIRHYLSSKGFTWKEARRSSGLQAVFNCPFCKDNEKSFAVNLEDGAYNCLRKNNCGVSGSFWQLQKALGDEPKRLNSNYNINPAAKKVYSKPNASMCNKEDQTAIAYFKTRKISEETVKKFRVKQTKDNNAIAFPYFKNEQLVGIKYRGIQEKKFWSEKNQEPVLYNMDSCGGDTLVLCEGEIDCMSFLEYQINAASLPNGTNGLEWIENIWDWLEQFKKIFLVMDMDEAGQNAVEQIANRLGKWRCYHVELPYGDVNECLVNGLTVDDMKKIFIDSKDFTHPKVKPASDYIDAMLEYVQNKERLYGIKIGFSGLHDILRGWRFQEWTVWTGRNASGKTTMLNQIQIQLIEESQRVCIASLEMSPLKLLNWHMKQISKYEHLEEKEIRRILNYLGNNLILIDIQGSAKYDDIIDMFQFAARKYGCKHFFVDNLDELELDHKYELAEHKKIAKKTNTFVKDYDCHLHFVIHPRKGQKDSDRPDKVDVQGSGTLTNLAFNVLALYKPTPEEKEKEDSRGIDIPDGILYVKKNREWGREGSIDFDFSENNKTFTERGIE